MPGRFQGRSLPRNDPCAVLLGRVGRGESAHPTHRLLFWEQISTGPASGPGFGSDRQLKIEREIHRKREMQRERVRGIERDRERVHNYVNLSVAI